MILKKVVDFFDFEFFNIIIPSFKIAGFQFSGYEMYRWPIFNIADIGISVGVIALFILIWFEESQPEEFQEEGVSKIEQPIL
ncbi:MAG: hypothetical protein B6244_11765 [Candidatus Cloacimonetes bacterium 4572_55]|nr:MAG: hypothetical protein B6244_11765 [Candidatus Cloacimonetes bacterium 4572_55]